MAQTFPLVQTDNREVNQLQSNLRTTLGPVLSSPLAGALSVTSVALVSGSNTVNHGLGRTLTGWVITRMRGSFVQVYDNQASNASPTKNLILVSNGACTVDLVVF